MRKYILGAGLLALVWTVNAKPTPAPAQAPAPLPRSVVIATHPVGTSFHAMGTGIAKVLTEQMPLTAVVRPHSGPPAWLPQMNRGQVELGLLLSPEAASAYRGSHLYEGRPTPNIRYLLRGGSILLAFIAPKISDIKTTADLKGKRVPADWTGVPIGFFTTSAALATAGLSYNDVVKVPASNYAEGARLFIEKRTEAGWHSVGSPAAEEMNARLRGGIRFLPVGTGREALERALQVLPGVSIQVVKAGSYTGVENDTPVLAVDINLISSAELSEAAAYQVVKTIWDKIELIQPLHALLKQWTRERMMNSDFPIPVHPGAMKFYKEKGLLTTEMDRRQQQLLGK